MASSLVILFLFFFLFFLSFQEKKKRPHLFSFDLNVTLYRYLYFFFCLYIHTLTFTMRTALAPFVRQNRALSIRLTGASLNHFPRNFPLPWRIIERITHSVRYTATAVQVVTAVDDLRAMRAAENE